MQGELIITKAEGVKLTPKKYKVEYTAIFTDENEEIKQDLQKTIEDKIKNLALLAEKIPIDSGMFAQMLRQQLSWEVGKFGIRLKEITIKASAVEEEKTPLVE